METIRPQLPPKKSRRWKTNFRHSRHTPTGKHATYGERPGDQHSVTERVSYSLSWSEVNVTRKQLKAFLDFQAVTPTHWLAEIFVQWLFAASPPVPVSYTHLT